MESKKRITFSVVVEKHSLDLIFSFFGSCNSEPVELKQKLYQSGAMKFISLEASLQISNRGFPGPDEGKYVGIAIFENQEPAMKESKKSWLPLLLNLFP